MIGKVAKPVADLVAIAKQCLVKAVEAKTTLGNN